MDVCVLCICTLCRDGGTKVDRNVCLDCVSMRQCILKHVHVSAHTLTLTTTLTYTHTLTLILPFTPSLTLTHTHTHALPILQVSLTVSTVVIGSSEAKW